MKKGINAWCFPADYDIRQCMEMASISGFDGLEINMEESDINGKEEGESIVLSLSSNKKDLDKIKSLAKEFQIDLPSISTGLFWKYPLTSEDPAVCAKAKDIVKKMIDAAKYLGADTILVVPGLVDEQVSYKKAYQRSLESLKELSAYAEQNQIYIGIENVWNKFLMSPIEMRRFIDEINSPLVGAYFDVGNVLNFSYPEYWIEILAETIKKVHVKDFKTSVGNINGFVNLLEGDVNWEKVIRALRAIDYQGYLTAELSPYSLFPKRLVQDTSSSLDDIISEK